MLNFTVGETTYAAGSTATIANVGTLVIGTNGAYTFTPAANYNGTVPTVSYTVTDGSGSDVTSTLNISVTPVDDSFTDASETVTTSEDALVTGSVLTGTSSVDGPVSVVNFTVGGTQYQAGDTATIANVGTLVIGTNGAYTFTPAANYNGTVPTVSYTVTDGSGSDVTSTLNISVTPVDDSFTDISETVTTSEDAPVNGSVLTGTSSVDGPVSVLNFTVGETTYAAGSTATIANVGTLVIGTNGAYTFTPAANYNGSVPTVSYTVTDGSGSDVTSTLNISVTPVDDSFTDISETVTTSEDALVTGSVLTGTSSVDGPVSVVNFTVGGTQYQAGDTATIANVGTLVLAANGAYTFTPAANYNGTVPTVSYTVTDGSGSDVTSTLNISVTPVDDSFTDISETVTTSEDAPVNGSVLTGTSSVDGPVSVVNFTVGGTQYQAGDTATLANVGTLTIGTNGAYTFTPAANYNGTVPTVSYTVTDGSGADVTSTLNISVTPVDDSFTDISETVTTSEDAPVTGSVLTDTSSVDGPVSVVNFTVGGTQYQAGETATIANIGTLVIGTNGAYTFTPAANYNGTVPTVSYTVTDGSGSDVTSTLTISVTPVDDSFTDASETVTTSEDAPVNGSVLTGTSSVDGPVSVVNFTIGETTYAAGSTATIANVGTLVIGTNGAYTFTPATNYNGTVPTVSYTVTDGSGSNVTSTLNISVTPVDDQSVLTADTNTVDEDHVATGNVLGNDSDVDNALSVATFTVQGVTGSFTAGQVATIAGIGTVTIAANGDYSFTPTANWNGTAPQISYTTNTNSISTLDITVNSVNDAPTVSTTSVTGNEDQLIAVQLGGNDIDGTVEHFNLTSLPANGVFYADAAGTIALTASSVISATANGATVYFKPTGDWSGTTQFTYTSTDNQGMPSASSATGTIVVAPITDTPSLSLTGGGTVVSTDFQEVALNGAVGDVNVSQLGNGVWHTDNSGGMVEIGKASVYGAGGDNQVIELERNAGDASNLYTTIDAKAGSTYNVSFDYAPRAGVVNSHINVYWGGQLIGTLNTTTTGMQHYSFDIPVTADGNQKLEFRAGDRNSLGGVLDNIDVTQVLNSGLEDHAILLSTIQAHTNDVDGSETLTLTLNGLPTGSRLTDGTHTFNAADGSTSVDITGWNLSTLKLTPPTNFNGDIPLTVTATAKDGDAPSASTSLPLVVHVGAVDDASVLQADKITVDEDHNATGNVLGNDSDVDNVLSVTSFNVTGVNGSFTAGQTATISGVGTLIIASNGDYTFQPAADWNGNVPQVTYTTNTGSSSTLNISVTPMNDNFTDASETVTVNEDSVATGSVLSGTLSVDGPVSVVNFTVGATTYVAGATATIANVGTLVIGANGAYTFTPAADYNGTVPTVSYTVTDGSGSNVSSTLNISVTPVNDNFIDASETVTVNEDTLATGNVLAGTSSVDGPVSVVNFTVSTTTYVAGSTATIANVGTLVIGVNGAYTFTPAADYNGTVPTVSYTVTDGSGSNVTSTLNISVTPVNDNFTDVSETVTVNEDTLATGNVLAGTSSVDGPVSVVNFTVGATTYVAGSTATIANVGTLVIGANGAYTFTPAADYNGTVPTVSYTVTDGSGSNVSSTLNISVTPVDDSFTDISETVTVNEDTLATGNVLAGTSSVDGAVSVVNFTVGTTTYVAGSTATIANVGTLVIGASGAYTFTPAADYNGTVPTVSYTVTDGSGSNVTSTLNITVTPVNDNFTDASETITVNEDTLATGNVLAGTSSVDGPVSVVNFTIGGTTYAAGATANIANVGTLVIGASGTYTFTPAANYNGTVPTISYTVTDGSGSDVTSTLNISVTPVNDNFTDASETITVNEDALVTGSVLTGTNSVDGPVSVLNFTVGETTYAAGSTATIANVGTLVIGANGAYTFTPVADYNGTVPTVSYTVTDGSGSNVTSSLNISVTPVNDNFTDASETITVNEDTLATGNVLAGTSSVDGPVSVVNFTIGGTTYAAGATANIANVGTLVIGASGTYTFTPAADYNGTVPTISYTVTDGSGSDVTSTLNISVTPVNDNFTDASETITVNEDALVTGSVLTGTNSVDGPVSVLNFTVGGTQYQAGETATLANVGTLELGANGVYTFTPAADYNGTVPTVSYTVTDGSGSNVTSTLNISVTPVDDSFTDASETVTVNEDALVTGSVLTGTNSVDGPVSVVNFTVGATTYAAGATATIANVGTLVIGANGAYTFTPAADYNGTVPTVSYTVTDGSGSNVSSTLNISVTPVNDNFIDASETISTLEDTAITGSVLTGTSSVDGPVSVVNFTVGATTYVAGATATIANVGTLVIGANGAYTFTPAADYNGTVPTVSYTVTDGSGSNVSSTLNISVTPVNDNFIDASETVTVNEDTLATGNVLAGTSSVDGPVSVVNFTVGATTYVAGSTANIANVGTLVIGANGAYTFTPAADYNGSVPTVSYTVTDGSGSNVTSTLNISVTPVNDNFIDASETISTLEDTAITGSVLSGTSSVDGPVSVVNFTIGGTTYAAGATATIANVGTLVIGASGAYTFTPSANYNGTVPTVSYTVTDGSGSNVTSTLNISVTPVDDPSVLTADINTVLEDKIATGNVLTNDRDVDNVLSVARFTVGGTEYTAGATATIANIGTLVLAANGAYTFTPVSNWSGQVPTVTYTTSTGSHTTLEINVTAVADAPIVTATTTQVAENSSIALGLKVTSPDTDGSETQTITTIGGIPAGATLTDGTHTFTGTTGNAVVDLSGWDVSKLSYTPAPYATGTNTLTVTAVSTESQGDSATSSIQIPITINPAVYNAVTATAADDTITGTSGNDIMVADIGGLTVVPGTNYNIAFMVDSSGSMSSSSINSAKDSLTSVFNTLKQSMGGNSGTVNIFLVDFDTQVNKSVSVNLNDPNALTALKSVLDSMSSGGVTNYEDVFKTTANWFQSADAVANTGAKNLTYFITDGQPNYYQSGEQTNPTLYGNVKLDDVVKTSNYKPGDTFSTTIDSTHKLTIDSEGNATLYTLNGSKSWKASDVGTVHAQGDGTYELSYTTGSGSDQTIVDNSASSFALLSNVSNVEAIGLNKGVTLADLSPYDSDHTPQTNIDPSNLANSIIGHTEATQPGSDTVNGGDGNDILFGDLVSFNGIAGEGYQAMQAFVAQQTGVDVSKVTTSNVHQFITEHYTAFDVSGAHDGNDSLLGGTGNDILFGQGGNDLLDAGKGNDILLGGSGNDSLMGGQGNDLLIGGSGADTFVWKAGDTGSDVIKDFKASEGDRIDLRDLLQGETGSTIDNFLKITTVDGVSSLQVSSGGKFNGADAAAAQPDVTIKLDGNNWSSASINSLIAGSDPTIKIDHNNS
ncbi:tandem-95 repeat protein [Pseudomonas sp. 478]|uniref:tandem-95 repeat protein n=1 Tax=unclassified Pseudomonas TaxID=196821 RepID=UPI001C44D2CC